MKKILNLLILIVASIMSGDACDSTLPNQFQMDVGKFLFEWEINNDEITIQLSIESKNPVTYIGVGFGTGMRNTDMIIGFIDDQHVEIQDYYSKGHAQPVLDEKLDGGRNDVHVICGGYKDGVSIIRFRRRMNTGDKYDAILSTEGETDIVYAWGSDGYPGDLKYHNPSNHAQVRVNLSSEDGLPTIPTDFSNELDGNCARIMVNSIGVGTLATIQSDGAGVGLDDPFPFASVASYADNGEGLPIILLSHLERNIINSSSSDWKASLTITTPQGTDAFSDTEPMTLPRLTLMGNLLELPRSEKEDWLVAKNSYLSQHPQASMWINFLDFNLYILDIKHVYFVGGFGGPHYIGFVSVEQYFMHQLLVQ